ncbi:MAG: peptide chain release factor N(5)-glutamine methyltransferase [Candidatus Kapabacteria bacterium]|nr:peptide chain release factor N(5)-glutamine methyltransferase [Candidatus Kapabacteria bacterium]
MSSRSRSITPNNPPARRGPTVAEALSAAAHRLERAGVDSPGRTAEILLCHVLQWDRLRLVLQRNMTLPRSIHQRFTRLLQRRLQREPLQYILGETEFYGLRLRVRHGVFIPRPETELLVEEALATARSYGLTHLRILDIGTGSGCVALAVAQHCPHASVIGVDVSVTALSLARQNARKLGLSTVRFHYTDILRALPPGKPFHIIVANPPYIPVTELPHLQPEIRLYEPPSTLTDGLDGLAFYRRFAAIFPHLLFPRGSFLVEVPAGAATAVAALFQPIAASLHIRKDYCGIERIVIGTLATDSTSCPSTVR